MDFPSNFPPDEPDSDEERDIPVFRIHGNSRIITEIAQQLYNFPFLRKILEEKMDQKEKRGAQWVIDEMAQEILLNGLFGKDSLEWITILDLNQEIAYELYSRIIQSRQMIAEVS